MQTESIFRAARTLEVIADTINFVGHGIVQHSFHGAGGQLYVTITGRPVEDKGGLIEMVDIVNDKALTLGPPGSDAFSLEYVSGNLWRVEAA